MSLDSGGGCLAELFCRSTQYDWRSLRRRCFSTCRQHAYLRCRDGPCRNPPRLKNLAKTSGGRCWYTGRPNHRNHKSPFNPGVYHVEA
jgi:hypothetical protein